MFSTILQCFLLACSLSTGASVANAAPPEKVVEWLTPKEHDFGNIRRERPVEHIFKFKNTSKGPIVLQTVRTSCGCTAANWTETPIEAGATGEVRIEYDAYKLGDFKKKITVFFDKQRKAETLRISGSVD
jgi:Protein of unknown function (DUF1573)